MAGTLSFKILRGTHVSMLSDSKQPLWLSVLTRERNRQRRTNEKAGYLREPVLCSKRSETPLEGFKQGQCHMI